MKKREIIIKPTKRRHKVKSKLLIELSKITHLDSCKNKTLIHYIDGKLVTICWHLKGIQQAGILPDKFKRVHISHIVNFDYINYRSEDFTRIYLKKSQGVIPVNKLLVRELELIDFKIQKTNL